MPWAEVKLKCRYIYDKLNHSQKTTSVFILILITAHEDQTFCCVPSPGLKLMELSVGWSKRKWKYDNVRIVPYVIIVAWCRENSDSNSLFIIYCSTDNSSRQRDESPTEVIREKSYSIDLNYSKCFSTRSSNLWLAKM